MKDLIKKNISFVKFCIVGGVSTFLDFIVYLFLSEKIDVILAKSISMCCSMALSYVLNKLWSFEARGTKLGGELVRYLIVQSVNLLVNVSVNYFVLRVTNIKWVAFVAATGVAMIINYVLQRCCVFKKKEEK